MAVDSVSPATGPERHFTPDDWTDFARTAPGMLAGLYLRSFWQPVLRACDLAPGRATPIRIMSEDFTLYRGEGGTPHLLAFRCAHRGTQLSTGWVEGDALRCFYHGWKYDGSGQCIEQPAEPEPFCQKVRVRGYPTEEYLGLIFAYLGEGAPLPLPRYPEFEADGVIDVGVYQRGCNYFQNLENDPAHSAFVHRPRHLPKGVFSIPRVSVEETEWGMAEYRVWPNGEFRNSQHGLPNIHHNLKRAHSDPSAGWLDSLYWLVPIDDESHLSFTVDFAHVTGEAAGRFEERQAAWLAKRTVSGRDLAEAVLAGQMTVDEIQDYGDQTNLVNVQDWVSQVGQGRIANRAQERLGRSDVGVVLYRKIWARELRALAEGRPITRWRRTERLIASCSPHGDARSAIEKDLEAVRVS